MLLELYNKLFVTGRFFTIALRKSSSGNMFKDKSFISQYSISANRQLWFADPLLVEHEDKTYLFYEAVHGNHGSIEVAEVNQDCTLSGIKCILEGDCHYSYPYVFQFDSNWYMIPESSQESEVRLYKALRFPYNWELSQVLLKERAVDTTVFNLNNKTYLLTFYLVKGSEKVIPHAFEFSKTIYGLIKLEEIPWQKFNPLAVRGAGPILHLKGKAYRPAQVSKENRYGDGLVLYRIDVSANEYNESKLCYIGSSHIKAKGYIVDGLHTYCRTSKFEVIDIRCCIIDYFKSLKKLHRFISKLLRRY